MSFMFKGALTRALVRTTIVGESNPDFRPRLAPLVNKDATTLDCSKRFEKAADNILGPKLERPSTEDRNA